MRRARAQAGLLTAVAALVLLAACTTGTAARLLTTGQDASLAAALAQAPVEEVRAVARLDLAPADGAQQQRVLDAAATSLASAASPAGSDTWTAWTSSARYLDAAGQDGSAADRDLRQGALALLGTLDRSTTDDAAAGDDASAGAGLAAHADLVQGRWPGPWTASAVSADGAGALEVAVPAGGATGRLALGARAVLAPAPADDPSARAVSVVVVGTYTARASDPVWQLDPLRGAGSGVAVEVPGTSGRVRLPAVGPLLTAPGQLTRGGVVAASGGALAVPQLTGLTAAAARAVASPRGPSATAVEQAVEGAGGGTDAGAGAVVVDAALPRLLQRADAQQRTTAAGVLVAVVVVGLVAVLALAAAAQLLAERRRPERDLLLLRGASGGQLLGRDAAEAGAVAAVAALLALPVTGLASSLLLHRVLGAPSARLVGGPLASPGGAASSLVVAGTAALAVVVLLVAGGRRSAGGVRPRPGHRTSRGAVTRSGADVLLVGVTAAAWWQLRTAVPGRDADVLAVVVPALALLATALLGVRATVLARRAAERQAARTHRAPRAVAAWALAREPLAAGTAALLVLAPATAATALVWRAAWAASVEHQVEGRLGTDLTVLPRTDSADPSLAAALARTTGGDPAPVAVLPVGLGTRAGSGPVQLVAVPAARSAELLRAGPRPAPDAGQVAALADGSSGTSGAAAAAAEPLLPEGSGPLQVRVSGTGAADGGLASLVPVPPLRAQPSLVVRDGWGAVAVLDGTPVLLDGATHEVRLAAPDRPDPRSAGALRVVGVQLRLFPTPAGEADGGSADGGDGGAGSSGAADVDQRVDVTLALPAVPAAGGGRQPWSATAPAGGAVAEPSARLTAAADGPQVRFTALVRPAGLPGAGAVARASALPPPTELAVFASSELAAQVGAVRGQQLSVAVQGLQLPARVAAVVPLVPVAPGEAALLVDSAALDAALLAHGVVPTAQRWWVGGVPAPGQAHAARAVQDAGLGAAAAASEEVTAAQHDPLAAGLRAAWLLLLAASGAAAATGAALLVAAAAPGDAAASARLAVLGVVPGQRARAVLAPHAAQVLLGGAAGVLVGTGAAAVVVPELLRAPDGAPAVPTTGRLDALSAVVGGGSAGSVGQVLAVAAALAVLALGPLAVGALVAAARRRGGAPR